MECYVYLFVRIDMPPVTRLVQACHAGMEVTRKYPPESGIIPNLVVFGIKNESKLLNCVKELNSKDVKLEVFREPDKNNEATAFATEVIFGEKRKLFKKYQCLK